MAAASPATPGLPSSSSGVDSTLTSIATDVGLVGTIAAGLKALATGQPVPASPGTPAPSPSPQVFGVSIWVVLLLVVLAVTLAVLIFRRRS